MDILMLLITNRVTCDMKTMRKVSFKSFYFVLKLSNMYCYVLKVSKNSQSSCNNALVHNIWDYRHNNRLKYQKKYIFWHFMIIEL